MFISHFTSDFDVGNVFKIGTAEFLNGFVSWSCRSQGGVKSISLSNIGQFHGTVEHVGQFRDLSPLML